MLDQVPVPFFTDLMQDIYELPEETKDVVPQVKRSVTNVKNINKNGYIRFPFPSIRV